MFTVEWSTSASFKRILGSAQVTQTKNPSHTIKGLTAVSHAVLQAKVPSFNGSELEIVTLEPLLCFSFSFSFFFFFNSGPKKK